jgi:carbamate kinase
MRVVIALGGNALLKRGEPLDSGTQRANAAIAARAIVAVIKAGHRVVVTHGNGPQIGLLAMQSAAFDSKSTYPLDVLGAESEGMIGYVVEREIGNLLGPTSLVATLLTQVEVDPADPAFGCPQKPIGPLYDEAEARRLFAPRGWQMMRDGDRFRRAVASPKPRNILEIDVVKLLIANGVTLICAGGGGIPVARSEDGSYRGVEAVIDKDLASALLAQQIAADALLMLTDVEAVYRNWGRAAQCPMRQVRARELAPADFAAGTMRPKIEAAIGFVASGGKIAGIGRLEDALAVLEGRAGTIVVA